MNSSTKTFFFSALAGLIFSTSSFANLKVTQNNTDIELNVMLEIEQNLESMMAELQAPGIKTEVVKQLQHGYVQHQTDQLVKNARNTLPTYKLNVILTE